jgi:hypothetical protein
VLREATGWHHSEIHRVPSFLITYWILHIVLPELKSIQTFDCHLFLPQLINAVLFQNLQKSERFLVGIMLRVFFFPKECKGKWGVVAHTCNSSHKGGRVGESKSKGNPGQTREALSEKETKSKDWEYDSSSRTPA